MPLETPCSPFSRPVGPARHAAKHQPAHCFPLFHTKRDCAAPPRGGSR
ncbi:MAG: hypothetical protein MZV64_48710 [Ignavibacteriales bacterium]|nr:hypothetical protein [Ignavibacteriales bacterium]